MERTFSVAWQIITRKMVFNEFGMTISFSIFDVILACLILGLFFRFFYTLYDR